MVVVDVVGFHDNMKRTAARTLGDYGAFDRRVREAVLVLIA